MKSLRFLDRRAGFSLASLGLLLGVIAPTLVPAFASAGTVTTRSIKMSSAVPGETGVTYTLTFTPATTTQATGGFIVDFCGESPLINTTCTAPTGMDASSASASAGTLTKSASHLKVVDTLTAGTPYTVDFTNIKNPTDTGTFYARLMTYDDTTQFGNYTSAANTGVHDDDGAVALSTTTTVGVTAYVQESMSFCVSKSNMSADCGTTGAPAVAVTAPSVTLGQQIGSTGQYALDAQHLSTDSVYAQLSTNAASGATVNMKSDATSCGGLYLNGDTTKCNIAPQTTAASGTQGINAGEALFGVTVGSAASAASATSPSGTLAATGSYDATHYFMNYVAGNGTGVTSTYGDPLFTSAGAPVNNKNIQIGLGASITNSTAAGKYGANLSLIATGTF